MAEAGAGRPGRRAALVLVLTLLLAGGAACAQTLIVNGVEAGTATSSLVPGTAYAPAAAFASALGARFDVDPGANVLTFAFGGRLVRVVVIDDPDRAAQPNPALTVDGRPVEGPAAVYLGVEPYVPVKALGAALGASVAFLPDQGAVAVVVPRAVIRAELQGRGRDERLVLRASAPTRVASFFNAPVQTLQLRFERADLHAAQSFEGSGFVRADVYPSRGAVDVRLQLPPDTGYTVTELPDGDGFAVVVTFGPARAIHGAATGGATAPSAHRVVLDPAPDADPGALTLGLAERVGEVLSRAGYDVVTTRRDGANPSLADRSAAGSGAYAFVSLHAADLPRGQLRIYHLGDAADLSTLDDAIRFNAETSLRRPETDGVRRQVLLDLVVDVDRGRALAQALARELFDAGGYQVDGPRTAPLAVLAGAGGRGLMIEVGSDDLRDPSFPAILAATLATVLGSGGLGP